MNEQLPIRELELLHYGLEHRRWHKKALEVGFKLAHPLTWSSLFEESYSRLLARSIHPEDLRSLVPSNGAYDSSVKVSVVLPVFNGEKYLRQSVESCLNQSHKNIEVVIVDDGSTNSTPRILAEYDSRVIVVKNSSNLHLPSALNVGFRRTTGELLTWTSHDNYYAENAVETLVRELCSNPDFGLVYSAFYQITADNLPYERQPIVYLPAPKLLPKLNTVGPCFLYRREVYAQIGEYDSQAEFHEDYDYWQRVAAHFTIGRLNIPLYYYRRHEGSLTDRIRKLDERPS